MLVYQRVMFFFVLKVIHSYLEPQTTRNKWLFPYCSEESLQYPFITHGCLGKPLIAAGCLEVNLCKSPQNLGSQREIIFSHHAVMQNKIESTSLRTSLGCLVDFLTRPRIFFQDIKGPCPLWAPGRDHQPNETAGHEIVHHFEKK